MIAKRATAILGAIALILLAIGARRILNDDSGSGTHSTHGKAGRPVVACTPDLQQLCDALAQARVIEGTDPLDLDQAGKSDEIANLDGWITWDPAPRIANLDSPGRQLWTAPDLLTSAPLAVASTREALAALSGRCSGKVTWACVAAATEDADLTVGVGSSKTAEGLARLSPLAHSFARHEDPTDPDKNRLDALLEGPPDGQDVGITMADKLVTAPGIVDLVVGPAGMLEDRASSPRGRARDVVVSVPNPKTTISVVVSWRTGAGQVDVTEGIERPEVAAVLDALGVTVRTGRLATDNQAGALWQLRRVGTT